MKKILFSLICALCVLQLSAQTLPNISNPGFEFWNGYVTPVGWTTSMTGTIENIMGSTNSYPLTMEFGSRSTDAHSGNYALRLQATFMNVGFGAPPFTMPGTAQLGSAGAFTIDYASIEQFMGQDSFVVDWSVLEYISDEELGSVANIFSKGEPFNMVPSAIKAWVKFIPQEGVADTMSVWAGAYREGDVTHLLWGDIPEAAYGYAVFSRPMTEYTQITIPMEYDPDDVSCDSLLLVFVSTSILAPKAETVLYVDDISFEFDYTSVRSNEKVNMRVYPNPATDYVVVSLENQADSYDLSIYDVNGKQIKRMEGLTADTRVSLEELSAGTYFLKVQQAGNTTVRKIVVE
jgi:hypothetical protein